jgi:ankyrin repeat protein
LGRKINDVSNNGWTAIRGAVECGHVDVVTLLLESGAKINNSGENDLVALLRGAADNGHVD